MTDFQRTLEQLAQTFTAREIMVPKEGLVRGSDESQARRLLVKYSDFDMIPIPESGEIVSYLERGTERPTDIGRKDMISEATSIVDLVDILRHRKRAFVLSRQSIDGYVHFSDLNNQLVKIPFFVIFESLEGKLAVLLDRVTKERTVADLLGSGTATILQKRMLRLKKGRADLGWPSVMYFSEILELGSRLGIASLSDDQRRLVIEVRNRVAHAARPLIQDLNDVSRLSDAKLICLQTLQSLKER